jgi:hypothetical protein
MRTRARAVLCLIAILSQSGCLLIGSSYIDGAPVAVVKCIDGESVPASAAYRFQRNGVDQPNIADLTKGTVVSALSSRGLFSSIDYTGRREVHVDVLANNQANLNSAFGKGFLSGLTFGLIGYKVSDFYDLKISLTLNGNEVHDFSAVRELVSTRGLIHGTVGRTYRKVLSPDGGFLRQLSETIHAALNEWQSKGLLCRPSRHALFPQRKTEHERS